MATGGLFRYRTVAVLTDALPQRIPGEVLTAVKAVTVLHTSTTTHLNVEGSSGPDRVCFVSMRQASDAPRVPV